MSKRISRRLEMEDNFFLTRKKRPYTIRKPRLGKVKSELNARPRGRPSSTKRNGCSQKPRNKRSFANGGGTLPADQICTPLPCQTDLQHLNFLQAAAQPTRMYIYLAEQRKHRGPVLMQRNISYMRAVLPRNKAPNRSIETIVAQLNEKHHKQHNFLEKNVVENPETCEKPVVKTTSILRLEYFKDARLEKEWYTVEAKASISIIEIWHNRRKRSTKYSQRILVPPTPLLCNPGEKNTLTDTSTGVVLPLVPILESIANPRTTDSLLLIKVEGLEARKFSKMYDMDDKRTAARKLERFPVFYEACVPFTRKSSTGNQPHCLLNSANYLLRLDVDCQSFAAAAESSPSGPMQCSSSRMNRAMTWQSHCDPGLFKGNDELPCITFSVQSSCPDGEHCSAESVTKGSEDNQIRLAPPPPPKRRKRSLNTVKAQEEPMLGQDASPLDVIQPPPTTSVPPEQWLPVAFHFYHDGQLQQFTTYPRPACPFCFMSFSNVASTTSMVKKVPPQNSSSTLSSPKVTSPKSPKRKKFRRRSSRGCQRRSGGTKNDAKVIAESPAPVDEVEVVFATLRAFVLHLRTFHTRFCVVPKFASVEEVREFLVRKQSQQDVQVPQDVMLHLRIRLCPRAVHEDNDGGMCGEASYHALVSGESATTGGKVSNNGSEESSVSAQYRPRRRAPLTLWCGHATHRAEWMQFLLRHSSCTACDFGSDATRRYSTLPPGHRRQYCYTWTSLPRPEHHEMIDSESEDAQPWLVQQYTRNVMEFTDVNESEKFLIVRWNQFLLEQPCLGDKRLLRSLETFLTRTAPAFHARGLRTSVLLHLSNLMDYGLITPQQLCHLMMLYEVHGKQQEAPVIIQCDEETPQTSTAPHNEDDDGISPTL